MYYRLYTEDGAIPSKHPVNPSDLSLGRINIDVITPPHTIDSIKRCVAKAEQLGPVCRSKLFKNMESEMPMDTAKLSVLGGGDRLGVSEEDPMVYIHSRGVEYRATQTACRSKFDNLDINALLNIIFQRGFLLGIRGGWTSRRARYCSRRRRTLSLRTIFIVGRMRFHQEWRCSLFFFKINFNSWL